MRIIHTVETYSDTTSGRVLKLISEALTRQGHEVTVLTAGQKRLSENINGVRVERFPLAGNAVRGIRGEKEYIDEYRNFILAADADVMLNYAAQTWATDLALPLLDKLTFKKIFLPCGYSRLGSKRYNRYFSELPKYLRQYDHLVYLSHDYKDKRFGDQCGVNRPGQFSVISNGADPEEFLTPGSGSFRSRFGIKTKYLIVNVAHHYLAKNHAMLWRVARSLAGLDVTIALVGNPSMPSWRGCYHFCRLVQHIVPNVRLFSDLDRDVVVSAIKDADLMLLTSTLECDPIVMYEAFAAKTPLVATPVGSIPEFKDFVRITGSASEIAATTKELLLDTESHRQMAEKAYDLWKRNYTTPIIAEKFTKLYETLCRKA